MEASEADVAEAAARADPSLQKLHKQALLHMRWCEKCACTVASAFSHRKRQGDQHKLRRATGEETDEFSRHWWRAKVETPVQRGDRIQEQRKRQRETKASQRQEDTEQTEPPPEYLLDFGKYKGMTPAEVHRKDPSYFPHLHASRVISNRPTLERGLHEAGLWEEVVRSSGDAREAWRARALRKREEVQQKLKAGEPLHKEVVDLVMLQGERAEEEECGLRSQASQAPMAHLPRLKRRHHKSQGKMQLQHCKFCGSLDHKAPSCHLAPGVRQLAAVEKQLVSEAKGRSRRESSLVSSLKYAPLHQRDEEYDSRPKKRLRADVSFDYDSFTRAAPDEQVRELIDVGLLADLKGMPCNQERCKERACGFGEASVLGGLCRRKGNVGFDISNKSVFYRCVRCRARFHPAFQNGLLEENNLTTLQAKAFWMAVEGAPLTFAIRLLNAVGENVVRRWYAQARAVMAEAAIHMQGQIVWGATGGFTTEVEADESCFYKYSTVDPETHVKTYHWVTFLGVVKRKAPKTLWLRALPVTTSVGEPRVPPLEKEVWAETARGLFSAGDNIVLHTDSAAAYSQKVAGVVEHHSVNHQQREWARSTTVLANAGTAERRAGLASTCFLDHEWALLKREMPVTGVSARTEQGLALIHSYVRRAQFCRMLSTADRWPVFCATVRRLREKQTGDSGEPVVAVCHDGDDQEATVDGDDTALHYGAGEVIAEGMESAEQTEASVVPLASALPLQARSALLWGSRYFEAQCPGGKCGQHALNNLIGGPQYDDKFMEAAFRLVLEELPGEPERLHMRGAGWYSHSVLAKALDVTVPPTFRMLSRPAESSDWQALIAREDVLGILCNVRNRHWATIAKENDHVFYVDSLALPVLLVEDDFVSILANHPMSFVIIANASSFT